MMKLKDVLSGIESFVMKPYKYLLEKERNRGYVSEAQAKYGEFARLGASPKGSFEEALERKDLDEESMAITGIGNCSACTCEWLNHVGSLNPYFYVCPVHGACGKKLFENKISLSRF